MAVVLTTNDPIRFDVRGIKFLVHATCVKKKVRWLIDAPEIVRFVRVKDGKDAQRKS